MGCSSSTGLALLRAGVCTEQAAITQGQQWLFFSPALWQPYLSNLAGDISCLNDAQKRTNSCRSSVSLSSSAAAPLLLPPPLLQRSRADRLGPCAPSAGAAGTACVPLRTLSRSKLSLSTCRSLGRQGRRLRCLLPGGGTSGVGMGLAASAAAAVLLSWLTGLGTCMNECSASPTARALQAHHASLLSNVPEGLVVALSL